MPPLPPVPFSFKFLLFFFFLFHSDFNSRNNEGPFPTIKGKESGRYQVQFMKAIVSNICFAIAFIY